LGAGGCCGAEQGWEGCGGAACASSRSRMYDDACEFVEFVEFVGAMHMMQGAAHMCKRVATHTSAHAHTHARTHAHTHTLTHTHAPHSCRGSPISQRVTFALLQLAQHAPLDACLRADAALVRHFVAGRGDFYEGVRAALIDRSRPPQWKFAAAAEVGHLREVGQCGEESDDRNGGGGGAGSWRHGVRGLCACCGRQRMMTGRK